jgi:hypothetical protein
MMQALARGERTADAAAWHKAFLEYRQARIEFYDCARRSMGLASADVPLTSAWLSALSDDQSPSQPAV